MEGVEGGRRDQTGKGREIEGKEIRWKQENGSERRKKIEKQKDGGNRVEITMFMYDSRIISRIVSLYSIECIVSTRT